MVSFDTVPVPPPVEDPEEKKEVEFPPFIIFLISYLGFLLPNTHKISNSQK